jgi:hypothetical protein
LELDDQANDDKDLYRKTASMLATSVGDGTGPRKALLDRLLLRLRQNTTGDTFDASLARITIKALSTAVWRHPDLINSLVTTQDAAPLIIERCRSSLRALFSRIPVEVSSDEETNYVHIMYGIPFVNVCELLLSFMLMDSNHVMLLPLQTGTPSANEFAKLIRQIDARLSAIGVTLDWKISTDVSIPPIPQHLHRMSPVAFILNTCLAEGAGENLVRM